MGNEGEGDGDGDEYEAVESLHLHLKIWNSKDLNQSREKKLRKVFEDITRISNNPFFFFFEKLSV